MANVPHIAAGGQSPGHDPVFLVLQQMPRTWQAIEFPRKDPVTGESLGRIAMHLLSHQEQIEACISAAKFAKRHCEEHQASYDDIYRNALSAEILHLACISEEKAKLGAVRPFFTSIVEVREILTTPEVGNLVTAYIELQNEACRDKDFDPDALDLWVDEIKQDGLVALRGMPTDERDNLLVALANRVFELTS